MRTILRVASKLMIVKIVELVPVHKGAKSHKGSRQSTCATDLGTYNTRIYPLRVVYVSYTF